MVWKNSRMTAEEVIAKLAERYRDLETYQNAGFVQITSLQGINRTGFKTYWQKPALYRFDWQQEFDWLPQPTAAQEKGILWSNSGGTFIKTGRIQTKKRSLRAALSATSLYPPPVQEAAVFPMSLMMTNAVHLEHCITSMKDAVMRPKPSFMPYYQIWFNHSKDSMEEKLELYVHEDDFTLSRIRKVQKLTITENYISNFESSADSGSITQLNQETLDDMKMLVNETDEFITDIIYTDNVFNKKIFGNPFTKIPL